MLDLDSPIWNTIPSSAGGTGALAAGLLRRAWRGDDTAYDELVHQVCHQFTVGAVAYVVVPHLVQIARNCHPAQRVRPLSIVGMVVAGRAAHPNGAAELREEWRAEYLTALDDALKLAAEALQQPGLGRAESQELLAVIAAIHGHTDLAMLLFLQGGATELSCPLCGEAIKFGDQTDSPPAE